MPDSPSRPVLRVGLVGCGRAAATLHAPALAGVSGATVTALADTDAARLEELGARIPGAARHADHRALIEDRAVDLVAVCVPASRHPEVAAAALRAGKHLFVEKPLALSLGDCDALVAEARRAEAAGRRSVVGFNLRSHRLLLQARAVLASGALGEIEMVRLLWTADWSRATRPVWHSTRADGGGALIEIGSHQVDLWRWLLDSEVESVQALARSTAFDDQTAVIQGRMKSGALATATMSQRTVTHNVVEVLGSRGGLRLSCYHGDSLEVTMTGNMSPGLSRRIRPLLQRAARLPAAVRAARGGGDFKLSYRRQWERIVAALAGGTPMPASVEDGRRAAAVVLTALGAAADGSAMARVPA